MAVNGYVTSKGYTTYDNEMEPTFQEIICDDHVCRPVIVDSQGRKRPIIRYTDTTSGSYPTRTPPECTSYKIVERVHTPDYTANNYGGGLVTNDKWDRQSISPPRKFNHEVVTKTTNPNYWQTTSDTTSGSYPTRTPPECTSYKIVERVHTPDYTANNYGGGLVTNDKRDRQSISPPRKFNHEVVTKTTNPNYWQTTNRTPTYTTSGLYNESYQWPKSNHPLTTTTNDIGEAVDFLKHAITTESSYAQPWGVHKRETYVDSREAASRYARPVFKQQSPSLGY